MIHKFLSKGINNVHTSREHIPTWEFTDKQKKSEQDKLTTAEHIIMVFPIYWVNMPAWSKTWIDQIFTDGFAYVNNNGTFHPDKLKGKKLSVICTSGDKYPGYPYKNILGPMLHEIANYTGMI